MGVHAGRLNRLVEIYEVEEHLDSTGAAKLDEAGFPIAMDETGFPSKKLNLKGKAWANVSPVRGNEKMRHGRAEMATMLYNFKIRFQNLKASNVIKHDGAYWEIQSLAPMGRLNREVVEVLAEQIDMGNIVVD
jgi:head-tail adaptor